MANELQYEGGTPGLGTVKALLKQGPNRWNNAAMVAPSTILSAAFQTGMIACTEQLDGNSVALGTYVGSIPAGMTADADIDAFFYENPSITSADQANFDGHQQIPWNGSGVIRLRRVYTAKLSLLRADDASQDEYTVWWYRDDASLLSGVTSPLLSTFLRTTGAAVINAAAMTAISGLGAAKYDATGANRIAKGEAAAVYAQATIDGAVRVQGWFVGRDSP